MIFHSKQHYNLTSSTRNKIASDVANRYPDPTSCSQAAQLLQTVTADRAGTASTSGDSAKEYVRLFDLRIKVYNNYLMGCNIMPPATSSPSPGFIDNVPAAATPGNLDNVTDPPTSGGGTPASAADPAAPLGSGLNDSKVGETTATAAANATATTADNVDKANAAKKRNWLLIGGIVAAIALGSVVVYKMVKKKK